MPLTLEAPVFPHGAASGGFVQGGLKLVDAVAGTTLTIVAGVLWLLLRQTSIDDPYITYRYARNVAAGLGLVYNPGEHVLSTTSPLYALVLAVTTMVSRDIPTTSNYLSVLALLGAAATIYLVGQRFGERMLGFAAAVFFLLSPLGIGSLGLETNLYLFLILGGYLAYVRQHYKLVAICFALGILTRGDAAIPAVIIGLHYLVTRRQVPRAPIVLFLLIALPFAAYLTLGYGSPVPLTLAAKQAQLRIGWPDYTQGLLNWCSTYVGQSRTYLVVLPLVVLGAVYSAVRARWQLFPLAWAMGYAAAYQSLGVASYSWYYAPLLPATALLTAAGLVSLCKVITHFLPLTNKLKFGFQASLVLLAALLVIRAETVTIQRALAELPDARAQLYADVGRWLRANTPAASTVGVMEVGIIGYYAERPMIDFLGLIRPASIKALRHKDIFWSVYHYQPDYLVLTHVNPMWGYPIFGDPWFQDAYSPVQEFANARYWASPITIYRRVLPERPELARAGEEADIDFGHRLRLVSFHVDRPSLQPGEYVSVALEWQVAVAADQDFGVTAQLIGADGRLLAQRDVTTATTDWTPGETVQYYHPVKVPSDAAPGAYQLRVAVYPPAQPADRLPVFSGQSTDNPNRIATLMTVTVAR